MKWEQEPDDDDDDFLEDLVVDSDLKRPATYSTLKTGGFVTKAEDRKERLAKRRAKIDAKDDDDDDDDDETEKEQLERETRELESELRKTEKAAEKARDKEERAKATWFSKRIQSGVFLKQPKAVSLVETKKKRKSLKTEAILRAEEMDEEDENTRSISSAGGKPALFKHARSGRFSSLLAATGFGNSKGCWRLEEST